ncbi:MAG TPA: flagellar type III secretion system protein FlhB [Caldimonas sp.]|jgi:flagellar biosynthetic protein FlhB|nr:flagellar type III secretion system protein FlhB [Caldimonas sp.]HEX4233436.1 flagellar type III secretion system protein FlhB [Caldimonas sp.]
MAASSAQDRTLPASARKLEKAREDGQVVRSRDLGHFAAIAGGGATLALAAPSTTGWLKDALARSLRFDGTQALADDAMATQLLGWTTTLAWAVLPFGLVMVLLAVVAALATGGWAWTFKPLGPRFGALDPLAGIGRVFSRQQVVDAIKASVLALVLGSIGAVWLAGHTRELVGVQALPLPAAIAAASAMLAAGMGFILLALAAFAGVDVPLQKRLFAERMKMSHQELRQEQKELDGNAEVKGKVRARMREMTRRRMMAAVPKADLVVMNPTHYAVALKYDDKTMGAPRVVAKGADLLALRIRELAEEASVPVLETPVLARALYAHAELDREIPAALFAAVAQVLAYVYQLRAALRGQVPMPGELPVVDVPVGLDPHFA